MRSLTAYLGVGAVLLLSGLLLMLFYVPHIVPQVAMSRQSGVTLGGIFRGIHFWAAQFIVLAALAHAAGTIFVKTNRPNIGWAVSLTILTGLLWFTGILLPWDRLTDWVSSWAHLNAQNALLSVYWTHVLVLTVLVLMLLIFYVRRTRRNLSVAL